MSTVDDHGSAAGVNDAAVQLRRELGLLTEEDVAAILGKAIATLQKMRSTRIGPPWIKAGQLVLYRRKSFEAWLDSLEESIVEPNP